MKDDLVFIEHILDSINAIKEFSKGITINELTSNRLKRDAIVRNIEIIGEAIKNISKETKDRYNHVQWKDIVGARDKMIHNYLGIDYEIVWEIIKKDLPLLEKQIKEIKKDLE
jgi:uncharacterized protein with HEPN domain